MPRLQFAEACFSKARCFPASPNFGRCLNGNVSLLFARPFTDIFVAIRISL